MRYFFTVVVFLLSAFVVRAFDDFDPSFYEEEAGLLFSVQANPGDGIYGVEFADGTWLVNTPIFGCLLANAFSNSRDDASHCGVGMIFRIMPHTDFAPFIGAGLTYNGFFANDDEETVATDEEDQPKDSFWAGHAEAGIRIWFSGREQFIEILARQTWNLDMEDMDYWTGGFGFGQNF